jgi:hypothetical protein
VETLYNNTLLGDGFGDNSYAYRMRFIYVASYAVIAILGLLCVIEYFVLFKGEKFPKSSKNNIAGLVLDIQASLFMVLYFSVNQNGIALGGYTFATFFFQNFFINFSLASITVCVAIITAAWISVSLTSMKNRKGWPMVSKVIVIGVSIIIYTLAMFFTVYAIWFNLDGRYYYMVVAIMVFVMSLFCVVSGIRVVNRTSKSDNMKDKEVRLRRMAMQLIALCIITGLAVIVLVILAFLPPSVFTRFWTYYGLEVLFPVLIQSIFLVTLIVFFRFSLYKRKLMDLTSKSRGRSGISSKAQSDIYPPGDISQLDTSGSDKTGSKNEEDSPASDQFVDGVITL